MMELKCYLFCKHSCTGVLSSINDTSVSSCLVLGSPISTSEAVVSDTGVVEALSLSVVVVKCSLLCLDSGCHELSGAGSDAERGILAMLTITSVFVRTVFCAVGCW